MDDNSVAATREFFTTRRRQTERKKGLTDEMGQSLADFVEATELNKTAVGFMARLDRLSPDKRADVIRSIDSIREAMQGVWSQEETEEMDFGDEEVAPPEAVGVAAAQKAERARRPRKLTIVKEDAELAHLA